MREKIENYLYDKIRNQSDSYIQKMAYEIMELITPENIEEKKREFKKWLITAEFNSYWEGIIYDKVVEIFGNSELSECPKVVTVAPKFTISNIIDLKEKHEKRIEFLEAIFYFRKRYNEHKKIAESTDIFCYSEFHVKKCKAILRFLPWLEKKYNSINL
jgi:putative transposon-encoded protein